MLFYKRISKNSGENYKGVCSKKKVPTKLHTPFRPKCQSAGGKAFGLSSLPPILFYSLLIGHQIPHSVGCCFLYYPSLILCS